MEVENNYREELVKRIKECEIVVSELAGNPAWKILLKDMQNERARLDDNWQNILEEDKLKQARILKLAVMHLLNIIDKYQQDLKSSQDELTKVDHSGSEILRDWDTGDTYG